MLTKSKATVEEIDDYTYGKCHILAVALHRLTGWPIHLVLDDDEKYWIDDDDPDNWIPATVHAFCVDDQDRFWDIRGVRHRDDVHREMKEWVSIGAYRSDLLDSEEALKEYVGCWSITGPEIDRPLASYSDADVEEARAVIVRAFPDLAADMKHSLNCGP